MASPMRKKRAWSTREYDAESQETAAFEATVAAAKDTAAKSGAFLSTAKSDLTDHQRWLQAQSVAVERDRARHERWLQRQRDHRLALARKDRARRRRQLMRQRAYRAVQAAAWASLVFVRSLILLAFAKTVAGFKSLGALIARSAAYLGRLIAAAVQWTASTLRAFVLAMGRMLSAGAQWMALTLRGLVLAVGRTLSAGLAWSGAKAGVGTRAGGAALAAGAAAVAARAGVLSRSAGRSIGSGFSVASARGSALADATGRSASHRFAHIGEQTSAFKAASKRQLATGYRWSKTHSAALGSSVYVRLVRLGRQAERYARAKSARAEGVFARAKLAFPAPESSSAAPSPPPAFVEIYGPHRDGVEIVGHPANGPWMPVAAPVAETVPPEEQAAEAEVFGPFYEGFWVQGVSPNEPRWPEPAPAPQSDLATPRAKTENALSSWAKGAWYRTQVLAVQTGAWARSRSWFPTGEVCLSQMLIIAGAVLLVCGGLLLGGGLFLRAGAGTTPADVAEESPGGIAWTFQEAGLPLPERAVFTLSGTPQSFRINGLSLSGMNQSDQPLTGVEAVLKPDVNRPELKLTLQVDKPSAAAGEGGAAAQALEIVPKNTVPPKTPFRLVFSFPPEAMDGADGITVQDFFGSYGGLLLKVRYELDGKQRSLIQYLPPDMLKAQLDEVSAKAGG
jgi:hypothetical protein